MHDLFGGALYAANRTGLGRSVLNNVFGDVMRSPKVNQLLWSQQNSMALSKEFLNTSAMKNARNWMIGGAAYGGITGANNGRRNGQGMIKGGIGGALRGGAMGFGGERGYAMWQHKIPQGWKNSAGSLKPFGR